MPKGVGRKGKQEKRVGKTKDDCQNLNLSNGRIVLFQEEEGLGKQAHLE